MNHGGWYIDPLGCIRNKKATVNPIIKKIINASNTQ